MLHSIYVPYETHNVEVESKLTIYIKNYLDVFIKDHHTNQIQSLMSERLPMLQMTDNSASKPSQITSTNKLEAAI